MDNSPVLMLQEMASSSKTDIEELLAKAKMISVKLGLKDISDWIEYEINGYPSFELLPEYRCIKNVAIEALNPYRGWIPFILNGPLIDDHEIYDRLTTVKFTNPISMIIDFSKMDDVLHFDLTTSSTEFLQRSSRIKLRIAQCVNKVQINHILSCVKTRILDWALLLEKKNILGNGLLFSHKEKIEALGMTINNNINNFNGNVNNAGAIGAGNSGDVNQQNKINVGDFNSLENKLKEYGVIDSDITDLKTIIENSPKPVSSHNLGEKIGQWVGNMIGKAYSGSLKIAASAAPVLLTNALCHYYGISV